MSIISRLEKKAVDTLADGHWVESTAEAIRKEGGKYGALAPSANALADGLLKNKADVAQLSAYGFLAVSSRLALEDENGAYLVWLGQDATYEEQDAVLDQDSQATRARKAADDAAWQATKSLIQDLLLAAGKAAIPILLAAI